MFSILSTAHQVARAMKIAIIGGGISGLVAAYKLHSEHEITLFEANDYPGGHTNTMEVESDGVRHAIDTGFIVFNDATYPNFIALLDELGVESQATSMSFSVADRATGLEYGSSSLGSLFAQRGNMLNRSHWRMLADVLRFNRRAFAEAATLDDEETVAEFCGRHRLSLEFVERYLYPMGSAIWSCPRGTFADFPVRFIIEFFQNHGLLSLWNRPQWRVVSGGSRRYVDALTRPFRERIMLKTPVTRVNRIGDAVEIALSDGCVQTFDHVIFACHSDQALQILGDDATAVERELLSAFPYQSNVAVLHTDETLLPRERRAWASWNYRLVGHDAATVTYNLNILQGIRAAKTFCVTLNDSGNIDSNAILRTIQYAHPVFTTQRAAAQARRRELIDERRTSFCGAYWRNGFHEDGVVSALEVVAALKDERRPTARSAHSTRVAAVGRSEGRHPMERSR
jgi:predicted NAD/FAD-binding protein